MKNPYAEVAKLILKPEKARATELGMNYQELGMNYQELIRQMICPFLNHCDRILINDKEWSRCLYYTLRVHRADHSKVVGSQGKMIRSLNLLITYAARRNKQQLVFELLEPVTGHLEDEPPFIKKSDWSRGDDIKLTEQLRPVVEGVLGKTSVILNSNKKVTVVTFMDELSPEVLAAFGTIFRAVGKSIGRNIVVLDKS